MGHAYTPGLKVAARTRHQVRRLLPLPGKVLVQVGDRVKAQQVVAETALPGDVTPINLANALSLPPGDAAQCVLKQQGDRIEVGEVLARTKGIFGLFKAEYRSKVAGTIESLSSVTGQIMVRGEPQPVQLRAYLAGRITEVIRDEGVVIEAEVTFVQGIFGIGGEAYGALQMACSDPPQKLTEDLLSPEMKGAVVVGGGRVTSGALRRAVELGVSAIVTGGIDDEDLKNFLGYDLGVAITGSEQAGLTLVLTEGFGDIAMARRSWELLASRAGHEAAVNGSTQIRAGVMRPEVIIPLDDGQQQQEPDQEPSDVSGYLEVGTAVRIIRDPYFGQIGKVAALPAEPQVLPSGSKARVLEVQLDGGRHVTVPRANVELIQE